MLTPKKKQLAWAFYDWANSAYTTCIVSIFFPILFAGYWSDMADTERTFHLGWANSLASLMIVLIGPLFGAIADHRGNKKMFLLFFMLLGVFTTGLLGMVAEGRWLLAVVLFVLSNFSFMAANIFYDAYLVDVAEPAQRDRVSAYGFGLGYLGGGLALAGSVVLSLWPEAFGFTSASRAVQFVFYFVALWWAVFSIPIMLALKDQPGTPGGMIDAFKSGWYRLVVTFRHIRQLRVAFIFLIAYWCYIDGVDTIIRMATNYGKSIGLEQNDLITAFLITQFIGFPAAIVYGRLGERLGAKTGIYIALVVYIAVTIYAYFMDSEAEFYVLATVIGLVQGGIQALSRSMFTRLIPAANAAEFFGFYNMVGKFAAVLGPFLIGWISQLTGDVRLGILAIIVLFVIGGFLLFWVDEKRGMALAGNR